MPVKRRQVDQRKNDDLILQNLAELRGAQNELRDNQIEALKQHAEQTSDIAVLKERMVFVTNKIDEKITVLSDKVEAKSDVLSSKIDVANTEFNERITNLDNRTKGLENTRIGIHWSWKTIGILAAVMAFLVKYGLAIKTFLHI